MMNRRGELIDFGHGGGGLLPLSAAAGMIGARGPELRIVWPQLHDGVKNLIPLDHCLIDPRAVGPTEYFGVGNKILRARKLRKRLGEVGGSFVKAPSFGVHAAALDPALWIVQRLLVQVGDYFL